MRVATNIDPEVIASPPLPSKSTLLLKRDAPPLPSARGEAVPLPALNYDDEGPAVFTRRVEGRGGSAGVELPPGAILMNRQGVVARAPLVSPVILSGPMDPIATPSTVTPLP